MAVTALRWVSAMYLLHLGWRMLGAGMRSGAAQAAPLRAIQAAALQLLNPKSWFMALATVSCSCLPPMSTAVQRGAVAVGRRCRHCGHVHLGHVRHGLRHWLDRPRHRALFNRCMAAALLLTAGWALWS